MSNSQEVSIKNFSLILLGGAGGALGLVFLVWVALKIFVF